MSRNALHCVWSAMGPHLSTQTDPNMIWAMTYRGVLWTAAIVVSLAASLSAQDWPQWRGPARDGAIVSFREPATWPKALIKRWQVEIGSGYAVPLVVGDR